MKTTKITTGTYKVEIGNTTTYIRNNNTCWEAYSSIDYTFNYDGDLTGSWACGAPNKKTLLKWIQEDYDNGNLA